MPRGDGFVVWNISVDNIVAKILIANERRGTYVVVYDNVVRRIIRDNGPQTLNDFFQNNCT